MDNHFASDGGLKDAEEGNFDAEDEEQHELAQLLLPLLSNTTLSPTSPIEEDIDTEAQQDSTIPEEESSSPMTWRDTAYVVFTVFAFFASSVIPGVLEQSGYDHLYFTKLTWYSVVVSILVSSIFTSITESDRAKIRMNDELRPTGSHLRFALFKLAVIYWGAWFAFYGTIWLWAVLHYPGSQQSVLQMSRVWVEFQSKMETKDALTKLTTCLREAIPDRNATIVDVTACLKEMGIRYG